MNNYRKVIIKIGSALINDDSSHNENSIENICAQISKGHSDGIKFAVVSSVSYTHLTLPTTEAV